MRCTPLLLCASLSLVAAACTPQKAFQAASKMAQVAFDPDTPVGEPKNLPSKATISLYVEQGVNRNAFGQSAPVDIWLFQLSDDTKLRTLDFVTLATAPKDALGVSYVIHKETQVDPGKSKIIEEWEFKPDTTAIGVAVGYKDINKINWRTLDVVKPKGETYKIVVAIRKQDVSIQIHR